MHMRSFGRAGRILLVDKGDALGYVVLTVNNDREDMKMKSNLFALAIAFAMGVLVVSCVAAPEARAAELDLTQATGAGFVTRAVDDCDATGIAVTFKTQELDANATKIGVAAAHDHGEFAEAYFAGYERFGEATASKCAAAVLTFSKILALGE